MWILASPAWILLARSREDRRDPSDAPTDAANASNAAVSQTL